MSVRADRQYVRVYHDDMQRDYGAVWADDAALAAWLRLLVVADKMWPSAPELPRSVRARPLATLVDAGLVELLPAHGFRIRGHDAERTKRQDSARNAAAERWHSKGNADRNAETMPSRDRAETEPSNPLPPAARGSRKSGTNPRANGTNPRSEKRAGMPESVQAILSRAANQR